jgi:diacylglycerol kinase (ATP)
LKQVILLHNPSAGDEEYGKDKLLAMLKKAGYDCRYLSTKEENWKEFKQDLENIELLVVAGGDGTVRKVVKTLLNGDAGLSLPIALIPLGTANNIANTLEICGPPEKIITSWKNAPLKKIDIGLLNKMPGNKFFIEGFGYGIFPYIMEKMQETENENLSREENLKQALKLLHREVMAFTASYCKLEVDGTDHSGNLVMAEIMNTKSIGPNLLLSQLADPGDGELEVILVPEQQKEKFAEYIIHKLEGGEDNYQFHTLKAKNIRISSESAYVHIDDELINLKKSSEIKITIKEGAFEFLIPQKTD